MATIGSPTKRTTSEARIGRARVGGIGTMPAGVTLLARSAAVTTASTPGMVSASLTSSSVMRPWASGERTNSTWASPAGCRLAM